MPGFSHEECDPARAGSQPQTPRLPYLNDYETAEPNCQKFVGDDGSVMWICTVDETCELPEAA